MADEIKPVADSPMDAEPDTVATPEGDNEFAPDQPLKPVDGLQEPRGGEPDAYKDDERLSRLVRESPVWLVGR